MRTFTVREVFDAIEQNGLIKATGAFLSKNENGRNANHKDGHSLWNDKDVVSGCALGQAARNLKISPYDLAAGLARVEVAPREIFSLNDHTRLSLPEIANVLRERHSEKLEEKFNA